MITKQMIEQLGLERALKEQHRQSGRSTRLIDVYIQRLFEDGEVTIKDHGGIDLENLSEAIAFRMNKDLLRRVKNRLKHEHPHLNDKIVFFDVFKVFKIKLLK